MMIHSPFASARSWASSLSPSSRMILAPGWPRPAITPRPSGPIRAMSKLGMATVGGTEGGVTVCGVAASTGGDGAGEAGEVAAALAAWPRMAGSPGSPRQASPRTAAVTTAPAAISQMRRPTSVATSLCEWKPGSITPLSRRGMRGRVRSGHHPEYTKGAFKFCRISEASTRVREDLRALCCSQGGPRRSATHQVEAAGNDEPIPFNHVGDAGCIGLDGA